MIYKKLLLLLGVFATLHAQPIIEIDEVIGNSKITFFSTKATKAWIGLYKEGTSNAWKNVQNWQWVTNDLTTIDVGNFNNGTYEARLFYNNSFDTEVSLKFTHMAGPGGLFTPLSDKSVKKSFSTEFTLNFTHNGNNAVIGTKNWVGIYKKDTLAKLENLLAWGYLKVIANGKVGVTLKTLNHKELDVGEYDMVYHQNDNYKVIGDIKTLTIYKPSISVRYNRIYPLLGLNRSYVLELNDYEYQDIETENDWVAIFKKDAEPIRENIIAWSYIRKGEQLSIAPDYEPYYFSNFPKEFDDESNYKAILFSNDSYEILGQTLNGFAQ